MSLPDWQAPGHSFKNDLPAFRGMHSFAAVGCAMKKARKAKANQRKRIKFDSTLIPLVSEDTWANWQSVMADAEEQMAELQRTIEWAREYARSRVSFSVDSIERR